MLNALFLFQVWGLTLGMLGSSSHPVLSAKAKESHGLLEFSVSVLEDHAQQFRELASDDKLRWLCP
jgi:hypothetical protein